MHDQERSTFVVKNSGLYPAVGVESGDVPAVGLAGARLLTETSRVTGLGNELSRALSAWRRTWSVHDPGKVMADLAVCVALGGPLPVGPFAAAVRQGGLRACCL